MNSLDKKINKLVEEKEQKIKDELNSLKFQIRDLIMEELKKQK